MSSQPFILRSEDDVIATFREKDQEKVVMPRYMPYPLHVPHYFAWTEPSGVYTYIVYRHPSWEQPRGLVFARNGAGSALSPAGMCDWCHHSGPSDEVGLLTTSITNRKTGGTWLCLDLSCLERLESNAALAGRLHDKQVRKLTGRIAEFFERIAHEKR